MALLKYKNRAPRVFAGGSNGVPFHHKSDIRIILRSDSLLEKLTQTLTPRGIVRFDFVGCSTINKVEAPDGIEILRGLRLTMNY